MDYRIEVVPRQGCDGQAVDLLSQMVQLEITRPRHVQVSALFFVRGTLSSADVERLATKLLVDPIVETYRWRPLDAPPPPDDPNLVIEVGFRPGVTDPVAAHTLRRAQLLRIGAVDAIATGHRYAFEGELTAGDLHRTAQEILCNDVIQTYTLGPLQPAFVPRADSSDQVEIVPIRDADDDALAQLSVERDGRELVRPQGTDLPWLPLRPVGAA